MSNYILYKKEPCGVCHGAGRHNFSGPNGFSAWKPCGNCEQRGHTLTEVDLVDVLRELGVYKASELEEVRARLSR